MYVTLRRYSGAGARADEIARRVEQGLVPILKRSAGFRAYCALASEDGDAVSVSIFDDREAATRANDAARQWVQTDLRDLLPDPPEVFTGETTVAEVSREQQGNAQSLYILIRKYEGIAARAKVRDWGRSNTVPLITAAPGFRGLYIASADGDDTKLAAVSLFDTRENAMRSHEEVIRTIQQKGSGILPASPRVVAGRALVLALA